ncbi:choice-of-anchor L domain-containing protein [Corallibacter sp.]|uniref:choice-of-anchor L domain-containing protein n=1 Tax=Corallibacter sp. TaxID=2038084 RepID=UPI003A8E89DF
MKKGIYILIFLLSAYTWSQNVQVDSQTYTPQQLIEDVLIDSDCITNVTVTGVVGGNFNDTDQSYGYFDATGTGFPFQRGIVLSTGRLSNVPGPNTYISDDDAPNWTGDNDLENALNESNTLNATILEFNFTSNADQINFRYLFASEEYQEGDSNTCRYSDLFGFLIRPVNQQEYTNIALVPNTQTPVKVTTVHSGIPNGCDPINEAYFGGWNNANAPINFNGQTAVLTATANIIPNQAYHVKLVIADEQNYRYDSAVFLEAGSFRLGTDLGPDRLIATGNPLCDNETLDIDTQMPGNNTYRWFRNNTEIVGETNATYTVTQEGVYDVEVTLQNNCIAYGTITVEYSQPPVVNNTTLINCDADQNGFTVYNLFDASRTTILSQDGSITGFFTDRNNAIQNTDNITNPTAYENTQILQTVYARIENRYGCFAIAEVTLDTSNNTVVIPDYNTCDDETADGITSFNLNEVQNTIEPLVPNGASIVFYSNENDAYVNQNPLSNSYTNSNPYSETLYVKITNNNACYSVSEVVIHINENPDLLPNETILYCLNDFPTFTYLDAGITNGSINNYTFTWEKDGTDLNTNTSQIAINETGVYTVTVTNANGCSAIRTITVTPSNIATIDNVSIIEASSNNSITIYASGEGDYEYALDNSSFQDSNIFTNVSAGLYTIFVRDKNGCGLISKDVSVLGFPKFFTPNGDGDNDTWKPIGITSNQLTIKIFDRYGKLIKELNASENGWNGVFNGQNMASDDYWYHAVFQNGKEYFGHFSLVR